MGLFGVSYRIFSEILHKICIRIDKDESHFSSSMCTVSSFWEHYSSTVFLDRLFTKLSSIVKVKTEKRNDWTARVAALVSTGLL